MKFTPRHAVAGNQGAQSCPVQLIVEPVRTGRVDAVFSLQLHDIASVEQIVQPADG